MPEETSQHGAETAVIQVLERCETVRNGVKRCLKNCRDAEEEGNYTAVGPCGL